MSFRTIALIGPILAAFTAIELLSLWSGDQPMHAFFGGARVLLVSVVLVAILANRAKTPANTSP